MTDVKICMKCGHCFGPEPQCPHRYIEIECVAHGHVSPVDEDVPVCSRCFLPLNLEATVRAKSEAQFLLRNPELYFNIETRESANRALAISFFGAVPDDPEDPVIGRAHVTSVDKEKSDTDPCPTCGRGDEPDAAALIRFAAESMTERLAAHTEELRSKLTNVKERRDVTFYWDPEDQ